MIKDILSLSYQTTIGIAIVPLLSFLALKGHSKIVSPLVTTGINVLNRTMGSLLVCVGIQFIVLGIYGFLTDETYSRLIIGLIKRVWTGSSSN
ncbi:MAG TPA: MarC family protein [Thermodesulfobacteriota bacterium]